LENPIKISDELKSVIVQFWKQVKILFGVYNDKQNILLFKWLGTYIKYLIQESIFDPVKLPRFKKGHIMWVDFGYNIGSELGGIRPAVVLEKNNSKKDKNIIIAPVRSYNSSGTTKKIEGLVYVGTNPVLSTQSYVDLKHIKSISKMRIRRARHNKINKIIIGRLSDGELDQIDIQLSKIFQRSTDEE